MMFKVIQVWPILVVRIWLKIYRKDNVSMCAFIRESQTIMIRLVITIILTKQKIGIPEKEKK